MGHRWFDLSSLIWGFLGGRGGGSVYGDLESGQLSLPVLAYVSLFTVKVSFLEFQKNNKKSSWQTKFQARSVSLLEQGSPTPGPRTSSGPWPVQN